MTVVTGARGDSRGNAGRWGSNYDPSSRHLGARRVHLATSSIKKRAQICLSNLGLISRRSFVMLTQGPIQRVEAVSYEGSRRLRVAAWARGDPRGPRLTLRPVSAKSSDLVGAFGDVQNMILARAKTRAAALPLALGQISPPGPFSVEAETLLAVKTAVRYSGPHRLTVAA